jgi:hypothetical protein
LVKLDLGCGPNKKEGFLGLDQYEFDGVDHVVDLGRDRLQFDDGEVEEVHASHFIEHLDAKGRCHLFNELHRIMAPGAKMTMIVPHWGSSRAYGDPTHAWPPLGEFWFYYLKREWREANAPHTDQKNLPWGYDCDFEATWGYSMHPSLATRNAEYQTFAMSFYREGAQDMHATLTRL